MISTQQAKEIINYLPKKTQRQFGSVRHIIEAIKEVLKELFSQRIGLICVVFLAVVFMTFEQGKDMLVLVIASDLKTLVFFITAFVFAYLIWYNPKYIDEERKGHLGYLKLVVPRLLGFVFLMLFAVFGYQHYLHVETTHIMGDFNYFGLLLCLLLIGHLNRRLYLFFSLIHQQVNEFDWKLTYAYMAANNHTKRAYDLTKDEFDEHLERVSKYKNSAIIRFITLFRIHYAPYALLAAIIAGYIFNNYSGTGLFAFCTTMCALALIFLHFTTFRTYKNKRKLSVLYLYQWLCLQKNSFLLKVFLVLALLCFSSYVFLNVSVNYLIVNDFAVLSPISVLLVAMLSLSLIFVFLKKIGTIVNLELDLLVVIVLLAYYYFFNRHDSHYLKPVEASITVEGRLPMEQYIQLWYEDRAQNIAEYNAAGRKYPVIIHAAQGGGSRGGIFTSMVHQRLDRLYPDYNNHLIMLTGASGGNNGNALYLASSSQDLDMAAVRFDSFFSKDFISSSLSAGLGRDLAGRMTRKERGYLLTKLWNRCYNQIIDSSNVLEQSYLDFYYDKQGVRQKNMLPLLLSNTTCIQDGSHWMNSAFSFNKQDFGGATDLHKELQCKNKGEQNSLALNDVMLLNSAFPALSPLMRFDDRYQFTDAGLFDNYGYHTVLQFYKLMKDNLTDSQLNNIEIHVVVSKNETYNLLETECDTVRPTNHMQLPGIGAGYFNMRGAHDNSRLNELKSTFNNGNFWKIQLRRTEIVYDEDTIIPIIPVARAFSPQAVMAVKASVETDRTIERLIKYLRKEGE